MVALSPALVALHQAPLRGGYRDRAPRFQNLVSLSSPTVRCSGCRPRSSRRSTASASASMPQTRARLRIRMRPIPVSRLVLRLIGRMQADSIEGRDLLGARRQPLAAFRRDAQIIFPGPYASLNRAYVSRDPDRTAGAAWPRAGLGRTPNASRSCFAWLDWSRALRAANRTMFSGGPAPAHRHCAALAVAETSHLREPVSALDVSIVRNSSTFCAPCMHLLLTSWFLLLLGQTC